MKSFVLLTVLVFASKNENDERKYGRYNTDAEFPREPLITQDGMKEIFPWTFERTTASKWHPPKWEKRDLRWNYLVGLDQKVLYPLGPILDPDIMLVENEENLILHLRDIDLSQKLRLYDRKRLEKVLEVVQIDLKSKNYKHLIYKLLYSSSSAFSLMYDWKRDFYGALVKALVLRLFKNPLIQIVSVVEMKDSKILSIFLKGQKFHQETLDAALNNVINTALECEEKVAPFEEYTVNTVYNLYEMSKILREKGATYGSKKLKDLKARKDETESCPICMNKCEKVLVWECDHMFCEVCDTKLLQKKCPLCRKQSTRPSIEYQRLVNKIEKLNQ